MIHTFLAYLSVASNLYANKTFVDGVERHVLDATTTKLKQLKINILGCGCAFS